MCHSLIFFAAKLDKSLDPPLGVRVQRGFRSSWAAYPAARWTYGGKQPHAVVFEMSMSSRLLGPPPVRSFQTRISVFVGSLPGGALDLRW